jgi:hypothetical protein
MKELWDVHEDERYNCLLCCIWLLRNSEVNVIRSFFITLPQALRFYFLLLICTCLSSFQVNILYEYFKKCTFSSSISASRYKTNVSVTTFTKYFFASKDKFLQYCRRPQSVVLRSDAGKSSLHAVYSKAEMGSPFRPIIVVGDTSPSQTYIPNSVPASSSESGLMSRALSVFYLISLTLCHCLREYLIVVAHPQFARAKLFDSPPALLGEQTALDKLMDHYKRVPDADGWQRWALLSRFAKACEAGGLDSLVSSPLKNNLKSMRSTMRLRPGRVSISSPMNSNLRPADAASPALSVDFLVLRFFFL